MLILPASPVPFVLEVTRLFPWIESDPVVMLMSPPLPLAVLPTSFTTKASFFKETVLRAIMLILPASPFPFVLEVSRLFPWIESDPVVMLMSPPLPMAVLPTLLITEVVFFKETVSLAVILTVPPFPCPKVLVDSLASVKKSESAVIFMSPLLPVPLTSEFILPVVMLPLVVNAIAPPFPLLPELVE
ncbi:hypothetical protein A6769_07480 [Nostoc punctiforme NIES-2108]|uniref:Uncharacterized protein n=1 Tax=Nostoc punctiforme NIES-2108 TaxID=1356359 RepID=A0A367RUJ3_NOSPU|nr:hypothetical protein A6769_07480 [Nostoc punctiforme NIES-2108]